MKQSVEEIQEGGRLLLAVALIEGGAVMAVELLGAKMIEPYFGSFLYVWSAVLGVSILGLTIGYYLGGIVSSRSQYASPIFLLLFLASLFTVLMPLVGPAIMEKVLFLDSQLGAIISSLFVVFPTLVCLGMVSPLIIKELSKQIDNTGSKTGLVFAVSTCGGIFATLLTGFYLIPEIGLRITSVIVSIVLATIPMLIILKRRKHMKRLSFVLAILLFIGINFRLESKIIPKNENFEVQHVSSGLMGQLMVIDYLKQDTRILYANNISQSLIYKPTGRSQYLYIHRIATYASFKPEGSKVLVGGLGGGQLVNEFDILGFDIDVCDIDPRMEDIARNYFNMTENVNVITGDIRHSIKVSEKKYDIMVFDVSAGENQPSSLYTLESFEDMKSKLTDDGVLFIHYPSIYHKSQGIALKSIGRTLKEAGYHVELINTGPNFKMLQEYIYFASVDGTSLKNEGFGRRDTFALPYKFPVHEGVIYPRMTYNEGYIMTDDKPMMDLLHSGMAESYRTNMKPTIQSFLNEGIMMY